MKEEEEEEEEDVIVKEMALCLLFLCDNHI